MTSSKVGVFIAWGAVALICGGCGTSGGSEPAAAAGSSSMTDDTCKVSDQRVDCISSSAVVGCGRASAECVAGTPNTLGDCVCDEPALSTFGPTITGLGIFNSGTFLDDTFYWSEYHFISGAPYSVIKSAKAGEFLGAIANFIPNNVYELRVTTDTIYVKNDSSEYLAYPRPSGSPKMVTEEEAFPPVDSRVTADVNGLSVDGQSLAASFEAFSETADGVYFIPKGQGRHVTYAPFADLTKITTFEKPYEPLKVWASGTDVYVGAYSSDGKSNALYHGDASVIGAVSPAP